MIAADATVAPSIWEKARMVTPSPTSTPGPKKTFGSTTTSRPSLVSLLKYTVSGSISVAPASIAAFRARSWNARSAAARSARELMPSTSSASASMAVTTRFACVGDLDQVGQVILALGVVVADLVEERRHGLAGETP